MVASPGIIEMSEATQPEPWERYRTYLEFLVRAETDHRFAGKIDGSGVVQQSLLEAASDPAVPLKDAERTRAYLRRLVANNLADEVRRLQTLKRDIDREISIERSLGQSSDRLQLLLETTEPSPSTHLMRDERLTKLAERLRLLPDDQRRAIELHHLQELKLAEVARLMSRTRGSVASLIFRGLSRLRNLMQFEEEN